MGIAYTLQLNLASSPSVDHAPPRVEGLASSQPLASAEAEEMPRSPSSPQSQVAQPGSTPQSAPRIATNVSPVRPFVPARTPSGFGSPARDRTTPGIAPVAKQESRLLLLDDGEQDITRLSGPAVANPLTIEYAELPPTNSTLPTVLARVTSSSTPHLVLHAFPETRSGECLTLKESDQEGRWAILSPNDTAGPLALLGIVAGELRFLWQAGVSDDAAELVRRSFLLIDEHSSPRLLRFASPAPLSPVTIDLTKAKSEAVLTSPVVYPEKLLRLDIESSTGLDSFDLEESLKGLRAEQERSIDLPQNPHVKLSALFEAKGKKLQAHISFEYDTPSGRKYGLTAKRLKLRTNELAGILNETNAARKALPSMESQVRYLTSLANSDVNKPHVAPMVRQLQRKIELANALIANEAAHKAELTYLSSLARTAELIHNQATVTCNFYLEIEGERVPLSTTGEPQ